MDSYKVIIADHALQMLDKHISYLQYTLLNPQAAESVWRDAVGTRKKLSKRIIFLSISV